MRNPLSKKIIDIQPSGIRRFFDVANEMKDAISLGVGEPDFDTPWRIREEGIFTLEKGKTFYTSNAGLKELRQEICRYLERKIHVSYDPLKETLITVGGSEAIDVGLRCMLDPGDEVLIPQPSYVSYLPCTVMADGVPVVVPLQAENEFKLTVEDLEKYTTERTKILIMPFPNNPTGAVMRRADGAAAPVEKKLVYDKLVVNLDSYELIVDGKKIDTPPKELELLYHLAASPNRVFTRNQLLDEVWGFDYFGDSRTVDVHIKRLREKLEGVSDQWSLKTVWGVGYKFEVVSPQ